MNEYAAFVLKNEPSCFMNFLYCYSFWHAFDWISLCVLSTVVLQAWITTCECWSPTQTAIGNLLWSVFWKVATLQRCRSFEHNSLHHQCRLWCVDTLHVRKPCSSPLSWGRWGWFWGLGTTLRREVIRRGSGSNPQHGQRGQRLP